MKIWDYGLISMTERNRHNEYYKSLLIKERNAGRKKPRYCEICGREGKIVYDHNHKTGNFRGWICNQCNIALGMVGDNPKILILLSEYLKNSN